MPMSEECDPNAGLYCKYNESAYDPRCDAENKAYQPIYAASLLCHWATKCGANSQSQMPESPKPFNQGVSHFLPSETSCS